MTNCLVHQLELYFTPHVRPILRKETNSETLRTQCPGSENERTVIDLLMTQEDQIVEDLQRHSAIYANRLMFVIMSKDKTFYTLEK